MTLSPGTKLGSYEILNSVGAGGMGEVYRAHDPRLGRDVAIKVSAERFNERFEREARAVAALNHPNICTLYDVGPNYLVMEFIEGEAPQGPMALEDGLKIARQIAHALEAAHEKGIVHRDLKPANIRIKPDGTVKVLDFGLAKMCSVPSGEASEHSPTMTLGATQFGMILGTAGYMAPEQARGKTIDKRADIWAFGVVLYELLTGERLFRGEDITEILASIVKEQPDLSRAPRAVQRLLRKCLEKDPKKRLRDIGDVWELLEEAPMAPPAGPARSRSAHIGWIAAAALVVALGVLGWVHFRGTPAAPASTVRFQIAAPEGTGVGWAMISPDGKQVMYANGGGLSVHAFDSLAGRPLPGTDNSAVGQPFWTADSRFVVFARSGKLWKVGLAGDPPQALCDMPGMVVGGFSTSDGRIVFASAPGGLQQVPAGGGTATPLANQVNGGAVFRGGNPLLPDGRHFLFSAADGIYVGSLDGGNAPKRLLPDASVAAFVPAAGEAGDSLLYRRDSTLLAQHFNPTRLELSGDAIPVAQQVGEFSVSPAGTLVYRTGAVERKLGWVDRQGKALESVWTASSFGELNLSPDGSRVAVVRVGEARPTTWLYEFARATSTRLTGNGSSVKPVWAPDGSRLAFTRNTDGRHFALAATPAAGGGEEKTLLAQSENSQFPWDWSRDGRWLLYSNVDPKTKEDLWALPMQGGGKPEPFLVTDATETDAVFSPDGRFVAYVSDESGKFEVYVRGFPAAAGGKWVVSSGGGYQPRWRRDGKELFYFTEEGRLMSVEVAPGPAFHASAPKFLFQAPVFGGGATTGNHYWDVSADGQRFLINTYGGGSAATAITVVLDWQAELKK